MKLVLTDDAGKVLASWSGVENWNGSPVRWQQVIEAALSNGVTPKAEPFPRLAADNHANLMEVDMEQLKQHRRQVDQLYELHMETGDMVLAARLRRRLYDIEAELDRRGNPSFNQEDSR